MSYQSTQVLAASNSSEAYIKATLYDDINFRF